MQKSTDETRQRLNWRGFLHLTAGGVAGIAGMLVTRQPPAMAQSQELTVLSFNHFVPQSDEELRKQAAEFARRRKVKVTVDTIAGLQLPSKLAAEVQTRTGHDVVALPRSTPYLYKHLFVNLDPLASEVLSWDDASNNRCLISGRCSWIHNPSSAYESARTKNMPIHEDLYFHPTPAGPAGRYWGLGGVARGIWNFSKHTELGKEFLHFPYDRENFNAWIAASFGFNQPPWRYYENHPVWSQNPKTVIFPKEAESARPRGWPAKPNEYVQIIENNYTLPNMVAKTVTGTPIRDAIAWGEGEVRKVLEGKAG